MSITRRRIWFPEVFEIEEVLFELASEMFEEYPDPMPEFAYLGEDHGLGLLESALSEPQQSFGGHFLHRTVFDKAAALFRSLVKNHPLVDGNKRLALTCVTVFLMVNGYIFHAPKDDAVQFTLRIAATEGNVELKDICTWLRRNSIKTDRLRVINQIISGFASFSQRVMDSLNRIDASRTAAMGDNNARN